MAIKFNVIQRGQPGVSGGGQKKHYASAKMTGEYNLEQLTEAIEKRSTVGGADIRAVLYALVDIAPEILAQSNIVRLGELGSLRMSVSSKGKDTAEEVTADTITSAKVIFTPGTMLKKAIKAMEFKKYNP
ncbi:HU family DNA-binding protein [Sunxiuqinia elliptica]